MLAEEILKKFFETGPQELLTGIAVRTRSLASTGDEPSAAMVQTIIEEAIGLFADSARPRGVYQSITVDDFAELYRGDGGNDDDTPLEHVIDEAVALALFGVTLGPGVSERISSFFDAGELAEGYILDQVASFAADELAQIAGHRFQTESTRDDLAVLPYSPGYCGWHVSGQRTLFAELQPGDIGLSINESCLMSPIKSVSGVLVLAPIEAHEFSPAFPCCATCTTLDCQERAASLRLT